MDSKSGSIDRPIDKGGGGARVSEFTLFSTGVQ